MTGATRFPGYDASAAYALYQALRDGGVDFAVYLPDSILDPVECLLEEDPEVQTAVCSREDEGIAIAQGAYLGGRTPVALMEGSGLGLSGLVLARGLLQRTPVLLVVSHTRGPGERFDYHGATRLVGEATLIGLGIPTVVISTSEVIPAVVREALVTLRNQRVPVGLFVPPFVMRERSAS